MLSLCCFRSMAQKESSHKEVVDDLTNQLSQVRKQHEELQVLSRDQVCAPSFAAKFENS